MVWVVVAAALGGPSTVPINHDGVPAVTRDELSAEELERVRAITSSRRHPYRHALDRLIELAELSPEAVHYAARDLPGLAWQAYREDTRSWLRLVATLEPERREALRRERVVVPWDDMPPEFQRVLKSELAPIDPSGAQAELTVLTVLRPLPVRFLRNQVVGPDGEVLGSGMLGFRERPARRILGGRAIQRWAEAGERFASWPEAKRFGPLLVHHDPRLTDEDAGAAAEAMVVALEATREWAGGGPTADIHVFLYPDDGMPDYGLPAAYDFALTDHRQIHQRLHATPGHELAHVALDEWWGDRGTTMVSEGAAVLLNGAMDPLAWARERGSIEAIGGFRELASAWELQTEDDYLAAAVFVAYAYQEHGVEELRAAWSSSDPVGELFEEGADVEAAVETWLATQD